MSIPRGELGHPFRFTAPSVDVVSTVSTKYSVFQSGSGLSNGTQSKRLIKAFRTREHSSCHAYQTSLNTNECPSEYRMAMR